MASSLASAIKTITLLDGHKIPQLAIGTGTALFGRDAQQPIISALEHSILHIDTAQAYRYEEHVGAALAAFLARDKVPREHLYVTTKVNTLARGKTPVESLQASLGKLLLKYVDLFLIHFPTAFQREGELEEVWRGMEEIKDKGLARSVGVSNFRVKDLERASAFHPYVYKALKPLLAFQPQHGIVTESYGGLSPITRHKGGPVPSVLQQIAQRIGKGATEEQILLRWLEAKEVVAVTTTNKPEWMKEYLAAYELPALTKDDVAAIDKAGEEVHSRHFARYMDDL